MSASLILRKLLVRLDAREAEVLLAKEMARHAHTQHKPHTYVVYIYIYAYVDKQISSRQVYKRNKKAITY